MSYVLMIVGLLTACVPEETSLTRLFVQGFAGLAIFGFGVLLALDKQEA
jgi:hypothetical protein